MSPFSWKDLKFWQSGEYQVVEERLRDVIKARKTYNPVKANLFKALDACPYEDVKVLFCGQDPYPNRDLATGLAYSIPANVENIPPTLRTLFDEYEADLKYPRPSSGDLTPWAQGGVLLWNVIPSCTTGQSLSHDWVEWAALTEEIVDKLSEKGVVFVFLGGRARSYAPHVRDKDNCRVIETAHPSPRGNMWSRLPFKGSRTFSTINAYLVEIGHDPIDWKLP